MSAAPLPDLNPTLEPGRGEFHTLESAMAWVEKSGYGSVEHLGTGGRIVLATPTLVFKAMSDRWPDDRADRAWRDAEAHRQLAAEGLPVPRLVEPVMGDPTMLIFERVPARRALEVRDIGAVVKILRRIHEGRWERIRGGFSELTFRRIHDYRQRCGRRRARARDALAIAETQREATSGTARVHGDLYTENIWASPKGVWVTDFEGAGVGCAEWDLATFCAGRPALAGALLEAYERHDPVRVWQMGALKLSYRVLAAMSGHSDDEPEVENRWARLENYLTSTPSELVEAAVWAGENR